MYILLINELGFRYKRVSSRKTKRINMHTKEMKFVFLYEIVNIITNLIHIIVNIDEIFFLRLTNDSYSWIFKISE